MKNHSEHALAYTFVPVPTPLKQSQVGDNGPTIGAPRWTLITVTYNSAPALKKFWGRNPIPPHIEWIVADNASTDDSVDVARAMGARVVRITRNVGFSRANNIAFSRARGEFVAFLNPDVRAEFSDLVILERALSVGRATLVGPQLMNEDGTLQPNGRGFPFLLDKIAHRVHPPAVDGNYLRTVDQDQEVDVVCLMGAAVAGRRDWLARLGPWDPRYFIYYEDHELGLQNAATGGVTRLVGTVRWVHGWARETTRLSLRPWLREFSSFMKFYSRHPEFLKGTHKTADLFRQRLYSKKVRL